MSESKIGVRFGGRVMSDQMGNAAAGRRRNIVLIVAGFIVSLGAVVAAINTIVTDGKGLTCGHGLQFRWCDLPIVPDSWSVGVGGPGGNPFNPITCRAEQVLIGLYGKADSGPFIYSIGPICAAARFNQYRQIVSLAADTMSKGDEVGSEQGAPFELKCPSNMFVIGYELDSAVINTNFGPNEYLAAPLRLRCSSILSAANTSLFQTASGVQKRQANASGKPFFCPDGAAAFGIKGNAGQFVDALSVGCRGYP
jgi:hypothetical protein